MPASYKFSPAASISIPIAPLTPNSFASFGSVIENPRAAPSSSATVNQGTAAKYPEISPFAGYPAPSGKPGLGRLNLFVCNPRQLTDDGKTFTVSILERHPYTTQTFIPIGLDRNDPKRRYLVIVAPTLAVSSGDEVVSKVATPSSNNKSNSFWSSLSFRNKIGLFGPKKSSLEDSTSKTAAPTAVPRGRGLPDLSNIKAFIARGDQAVTYGVGTWHAPMVVLGDGPIEFVVVMHENGVALEDCEECDIEGGKVKVEVVPTEGEIKAKL